MKQRLILLLTTFLFSFSFCNSPHGTSAVPKYADSITKVEMNLSAFGVESDDFPSIECFIDFEADSSQCKKSYYDPAHQPSIYKLSKAETKKVLALLQSAAFEKLKPEYTVSMPDQPTSVVTIYAGERKFTIKDYGLKGEYPLQKLYKIIYKY